MSVDAARASEKQPIHVLPLLLAPAGLDVIVALIGGLEYYVDGRESGDAFLLLVWGTLLFAVSGTIYLAHAGGSGRPLAIAMIPLLWLYAGAMGVFGYLLLLTVGPSFC